MAKPKHMIATMRPYLRVLRQYPQFDPEELDRLERRNPSERREVETTQRLLRHTVEVTGDAYLGLRAARAVEVGDFEMLEYVCASAGTFGEALESLVRYRRLWDESADVRLLVQGDEARLILESSVPLEQAGVEYQVAAVFMTIQHWMRPERARIGVRFRAAPPAELGQYTETFGDAAVSFGADWNGLVFAAPLLATSLRTAEATVHSMMGLRASRQLEQLAMLDKGWLGRVRADILANLAGSRTSAADAAGRLGVSRRTLARRLQQEADTTYSLELTEMRKRTAEHYLRESEYRIEEIAFLLGYSESPTFVRAFKRWVGVPPMEYRRRVAKGAPAGPPADP